MKNTMNSILKVNSKLCVFYCGNIRILIGDKLDKQEDKIDKKKTKKNLKNKKLMANGDKCHVS